MMLSSTKYILKQNSKTFYIASLFLPKNIKKKVLSVYAFCRLYDDNVDHERSVNTLDLEKKVLGFGIEKKVVDQLKEGIDSDMYSNRISSTGDLLNYCYKVAGCVGIMMCDVLNINDRRAKYHAIDLGIAMQITNICRDIKEDFSINRIYLPKDKISKSEMIERDQEKLFIATCDLIALSDKYYESALEGIKYIPFNTRFSILFALYMYQEIGIKIKRNKKRFLDKKPNTTKIDKLRVFTKTVFIFLYKYLLCSPKDHNHLLHSSLKGLPNIHESL
jgi:phytoene synthase